MSPEAAQTIYTISRVLVLVGSLAGLMGSIGWFWAGSAREEYRQAEANAKVAEANQVAAKWAEEAVQHRGKLAKPSGVSQDGNGRKVTPEQASLIVERLRFLVKAPISLAAKLDDPEAIALANSLAAALTSAGFSITRVVSDPTNNQPGLTLVVGNAAAPPDGSMELFALLKELGFACNEIANNQEMQEMYLEVGARPTP